MTAPPSRLTHDPNRRRDIAHVGPVELYTPVLDASRDFFVDQMGLREVHRTDDSVYLHTWDDYQSWTVRLIQRDKAGMFPRDVLGARCTEQIVKDDGSPQAIWYSLGNKTYDLVYTEDWTGSRGRLHHLAFATDTREEILRAADVCPDAGVHIETGPHTPTAPRSSDWTPT